MYTLKANLRPVERLGKGIPFIYCPPGARSCTHEDQALWCRCDHPTICLGKLKPKEASATYPRSRGWTVAVIQIQVCPTQSL